jgi:hypothetical protein
MFLILSFMGFLLQNWRTGEKNSTVGSGENHGEKEGMASKGLGR